MLQCQVCCNIIYEVYKNYYHSIVMLLGTWYVGHCGEIREVVR